MNVVAFVVFQDVLHNCQLHRISFCADDKTDKRIFTFICKDSESNKHLCYVFDSEKCVGVIYFYLFPQFQLQLFGGVLNQWLNHSWWLIICARRCILKTTRGFQCRFGDLGRCVVVNAGGGNNSNHRSGLWLGLQEVPGVWRQRRRDQETDWNFTEEGTFIHSVLLIISIIVPHYKPVVGNWWPADQKWPIFNHMWPPKWIWKSDLTLLVPWSQDCDEHHCWIKQAIVVTMGLKKIPLYIRKWLQFEQHL